MSQHFSLYPALGTHRGLRRETNEDSVGFAYPPSSVQLDRYGAAFVVADGVGGRTNGEGASDMAIKLMLRMYYQSDPALSIEERLVGVIQSVNAVVFQQLNPSATTLTVAVLCQQTLTVASVGDSAAFLISSGRISKLTKDHIISDPVSGKPKLTRAIGHKPTVTVDTIEGEIKPGDFVLLVTDGVTRYFQPDQLLSLINQRSPIRSVEVLIHECNARGGTDNISAGVIEVGEPFANETVLSRHIQQLGVYVDVPDAPPPDDADAPSTEFAPPAYQDQPVRRSSPLPDTRPLQLTDEHLKKLDQMTGDKPQTSNNALYNAAVVILLLLGAGAIFMLQQGFNPLDWLNRQDAPAATATTQATPAPAAVETAQPTTEAAVIEGAELVFSGSVPTQIQIGSDVTSFTITPGMIYVVEAVFEREGETWVRLQEQDSRQSGWIKQDDLPEFSTP
jgi:PPM family protein phosphatase